MRGWLCAVICGVTTLGGGPAMANEVWVVPTIQADGGGLGLGVPASFPLWPATRLGVVRLAFGVPNDLGVFQSAALVLIPEAPAGPATLTVYVCAADDGAPAAGACSGPVAYAFTGMADTLQRVDITGALAGAIGTPGATHLAVLAYTTPTTGTDHIVGMRVAYDPLPVILPPGSVTTAELAFDPATQAELDSHAATASAHHPRYTDGEAVAAAQASGEFATLGGNTFAGTQTIHGGHLDLDNDVGQLTMAGTRFLHNYGPSNTFLGLNAGNVSMTGTFNTATGALALAGNTTGTSNTALGNQALTSNTGGGLNTATGNQALYANTTGGSNTATGHHALFSNLTGNQNTATGNRALEVTTSGLRNTATGYRALGGTTTGEENTASGANALLNNTSGNHNTASGVEALWANINGHDNTAIGSFSLYNSTTDYNTAVGSEALDHNTTGWGNTAIGFAADVSSGDFHNATAIGASTYVNASNKIRLGNNFVTVIEGQVAYTFTSDRNQKERFLPVDGRAVLDKLRTIPVQSWNYIGQDAARFRHYGPVAQDFFAAFGHDGVGTVGSATTINSGDMQGVLMSAVQALEARTAAQQDTIDRQRRQLDALEARLAGLERLVGGDRRHSVPRPATD